MPSDHDDHPECNKELVKQIKVQEKIIGQLKERINLLETINTQKSLGDEIAVTFYCLVLGELTRILKNKEDEIREKDEQLTAALKLIDSRKETPPQLHDDDQLD
ncbi:hypothetical protein CRE_07400 [Caenorhabditis remanei]|uniref:Uncharacterized protein n=2 Tax=Caenorhabditis remanei TaxID=31234 RepID=E3M2V3_CAERE|nr:hypothetical protein CRE_07400 [Caenorhabditis remanei]